MLVTGLVSNAQADPRRKEDMNNERKTMNNKRDAVEALASSDLFAEICPNHAAIIKAMKWRNDHTAHVERLEADATHCFVPCRGDLHHPELWKAGSWRWLREFFGCPPDAYSIRKANVEDQKRHD